MGYDYTGYGACSGAGPSVSATCSDIAAVLDALVNMHGVKRREVVLYGQSVGSGPTVSSSSQVLKYCMGQVHSMAAQQAGCELSTIVAD